MSTLTYAPVLDGAPYDPAPHGGTVLRVELYDTEERDTDAAYSSAASLVSPGLYRFTIPDLVEGRYWPRVVWRATTSSLNQNDDLGFIDLPVLDDLVVSPEELAKRLSIPLPLNDVQRDALAEAIRDAQDEVVAYLGRPILPGVYEEVREWPAGGSWDYAEQPVTEVISETPEIIDGRETGRWVVRYRAGLDGRDARLRPIRRRVLQQAMAVPAALDLWRSIGGGAAGERRISSMSVEGQSVSYQYVGPDGTTGGGSSSSGSKSGEWTDIDRWRLRGRRVFERRTSGRAYLVRDVTSAYG